MDAATTRHPASLPPIGRLDETYRRKDDLARLPNDPRSAQSTPSSDFPPPPPYSQSAASALPPATHIPPPSHEPYQDLRKNSDSSVTQRSLPSIHEALGSSRSPRHNHVAATPRAYQSYTSPTSPRSASSLLHHDRRHEADKHTSYQSAPNSATRYHAHPHAESHPSEYRHSGPPPPSAATPYPSSQPTSAPSQPPQPWQSSHAPTERRYVPPPPPPADRQYAYGASQQPPYAPSAPSTTAPPSTHSATIQYAPSSQHEAHGRPDNVRAPPHAENGASLLDRSGLLYGESVKRHLDTFDLEAALNDIGEASRSLHEFSSHYSQRAHQTARSGPLPGSTPHLNEIDDMANQTHRINSSLLRLREVVLSQQAALAERSKEALQKASGAVPSEDGASAPPGKDGFAGADPKKRRGRAAPPGRCHSCNRAETPEWRRGPDGARTLCNACGLHYAKLTRKMASNKSSGGSHLKPKAESTSPAV